MSSTLMTHVIVIFLSLAFLNFMIFSHRVAFIKYPKKRKIVKRKSNHFCLLFEKKNGCFIKYKFLYYLICIYNYLLIAFWFVVFITFFYSLVWEVNKNYYELLMLTSRAFNGIVFLLLIIYSAFYLYRNK